MCRSLAKAGFQLPEGFGANSLAELKQDSYRHPLSFENVSPVYCTLGASQGTIGALHEKALPLSNAEALRGSERPAEGGPKVFLCVSLPSSSAPLRFEKWPRKFWNRPARRLHQKIAASPGATWPPGRAAFHGRRFKAGVGRVFSARGSSDVISTSSASRARGSGSRYR